MAKPQTNPFLSLKFPLHQALTESQQLVFAFAEQDRFQYLSYAKITLLIVGDFYIGCAVMRFFATILISIAMMMSGALNATAHTQLHLGDISSTVSTDHEYGSTLLHKSLYTHSDHDHHHDHDKHGNDHHSDDHASHCHGFAVTTSTVGIDTTAWDAISRVIDHDDRVTDPLYLAEHIPD